MTGGASMVSQPSTGDPARQGAARRVLQNFGFLIGGRSLGDGFTFLLFVFLSRRFGQEGIGLYSFAVGLTGLVAVAADFGLYAFSIKELSRCEGSVRDSYGPFLGLRLIFTAAVVTVGLGASFALLPLSGESSAIIPIILIIGTYQLMLTLINGATAVLISQNEARLAGTIEVTLKAGSALAAMLIGLAGGDLRTVLAALPAIAVIQAVVAYGIVFAKYGAPRFVASSSSIIEKARETVPYGLSALLSQVHARSDVVLIGILVGTVAAGVYNVAYRMVFLLMFVPHFASVALLPVTSKLYKRSSESLRVFYQRTTNFVLLLSLPAAAGLWLVAPDLIRLVFGGSFDQSVLILRVLAALLFFNFHRRLLGVFLMSCDLQTSRTHGIWTAAWVNLVGNLILIPTVGLTGAAISTVFSEALLVLFFAVKLRPVLGWPRVRSRLAIGGLGVASFWVPFALLPHVSIALVVPVSLVVYIAVLVAFRQTRNNEVRRMLEVLRSGPAGAEGEGS
jgi:O-antigen/teichoic acid export membrane protein